MDGGCEAGRVGRERSRAPPPGRPFPRSQLEMDTHKRDKETAGSGPLAGVWPCVSARASSMYRHVHSSTQHH